MDYYGSEVSIGDQVIMDEALAYLSKSYDLSEYDSDNNSIIDAVVLVTTLEIDDQTNFYWAYRYWNIYTDDEGYYYEYDGVSANDYLWCSYEFLFEDEFGEFTNKDAINTYTFIHEFSHVLGADDYYDYAYENSPLQGYDMMDAKKADHCAFTKFNLGWITNSRLVVVEESITLTLEDFSKNGDTIIIANNYDPALGAYQEYYILVYYTNNGLNSGDAGLFEEEGILMYHINASLYKEELDGEVYYDIYNNNTTPNGSQDYPGTENNLIEFVAYSNTSIIYTQGSTSANDIVDDLGNTISYIFTVDSLTEDSATITFTKNSN